MCRRRAFTLVELLVVIAVITVLMSLLMPALQRAREQGKRARCIGNIKNLTLCWIMYADDHEGHLPAGTSFGPKGWVDDSGIQGYDFLPLDQRSRADHVKSIKAGVLWPYTKHEGLYRCPTATATEGRTYGMPVSYASLAEHQILSRIHGAPESLLNTNRNRIKRPAERMTFLDENASGGGIWAIMYQRPQWWSPVPIRHGKGTILSFVDGHGEYWKWRDDRTIEFSRKSYDLANPQEGSTWHWIQPDNEDLLRLIDSVWGQLAWE